MFPIPTVAESAVASDWKEAYGKNDKTGRDSVFVECSDAGHD